MMIKNGREMKNELKYDCEIKNEKLFAISNQINTQSCQGGKV